MSVAPTLLLIADVAGYTRFMTLHAVSLAHAHDVVSQLLEAVIDAALPDLRLAKLEGDAAFFYLPLDARGPPGPGWLAGRAAAIHGAFHRRAADLARNAVCPCDGCRQAGTLRIKLVAHLGEVVERKVRRMTELAGIDVIVVHRLLKNRVPLPEYLLLTAPVYRRLEPATAALAVAHALELEGIGRIDGWYVDLERLGGETRSAPRRLSWPARVFRHAKLTWRSLPFFAGRREACAGFRNLDRRQPRTS
ncbi:MAG: DUF2652 domain-containing protein [Burkholderiales bacterium]